MKYTVKYTTIFKKDYKLAIKRGLKIELLQEVVAYLAQEHTLICLVNRKLQQKHFNYGAAALSS